MAADKELDSTVSAATPLVLQALGTSLLFGLIAIAFYRLYLHPLSKYPGPKYAALSELVYRYISMRGEVPAWTHRMHMKYGDIVRLGPNRLSLTDPQAWKDVHGHRVKAVVKDPRLYGFEINNEASLVNMFDDAEHSRSRKIFSNAFSDKALRQQEPLIRGYVDQLISNLKSVAGTETDIVKHYNCTTFDVMADLTFGESLGLLQASEYTPWVSSIFSGLKALDFMTNAAEYPLLGFLINTFMPKRFIEMRKIHFQHSVDRVERRMEKGVTDKPDIWSLVLEKGMDILSRGKMYSQSSSFMIAGTETTATTLSGLTWCLLKNPDKLKKVTEEVRAFRSEDELTLENLQHLKYLQACFEEGLRYYPPVPGGLARIVTTGGGKVCGEWLPESTRLSVPQMPMYRSPRNFKDPDSFIPERWLPDTGYDTDRKEALQPFSTGPRNCIGKNLAYHEMRIILAKVLWHFDLELSPRSDNWIEQKIWILWDKPPLWVIVKPVVREA